MKTQVVESPIILLSIIKWFFLASCVGCIVGGSTTLFLKTLAWTIALTQRIPYYFWFLPIALPISSVLINYLAPEAEGYGAKVIEAIHKHSGRIPPLVAPVKFVATIVTITFGGSAGKTGPCVQIGAALASMFASLFKLNNRDRRKLVICGISAGFAAVFGSTIAGAIFGIEVLFIGAIFYDVLFPSFISGIVAYQVASRLGITYASTPIYAIPGFSGSFFIEVIASGVLFGLCALLLIESLRLGERANRAIPIWKPLQGIIGGFLLIGLTYLFSDQYLGLGTEMIEACLQSKPVSLYAFLLKILFVSITLNFCGSGGIITPILFVGATVGNVFGQVLDLDLSLFSAIGMVSLLAGTANTPIAASIMAVELFGRQIAPYATVACITSFLMAGHRTVYPSQKLAIAKSALFVVDTDKEIKKIQTLHITTRHFGLLRMILDLIQRWRKPKK